jgi:hypothetical protein
MNTRDLISYDLEELRAAAARRPRGYYDHVVSMGRVAAGRVWLTPEIHTQLANYYRSALPEPKFSEMSRNFSAAIARWAKSGFSVASRTQVKDRQQTCESCRLWDGSARSGWGKCRHTKCGCTMIKWWLASERCPDGKW